jgi:tetratricopeptide (TPR) repeat protein
MKIHWMLLMRRETSGFLVAALRALIITLLVLNISASGLIQVAVAAQNEIRIINDTNKPKSGKTQLDTGPCVGGILNAHYYPGIQDYMNGQYQGAISQMDYVLARPKYTSMHPEQAILFSKGHYIRGMIYFYHASGVGRHAMAIKDFSLSLRWNPENNAARLELGRVYAAVGEKEKASEVFNDLLARKPDLDIAKAATTGLEAVRRPR